MINSTNSDEVMKTILKIGEQYVEDNERPDHEIGKDFIKLVYPFIGNMRILISIINEFWIYKRMLKKDSTDKLDDEKIMALMIYKNLYPQDFSDLEDERGMVKEAFEQKDKLMKMQGEKLNEKKNDILTIIKCAPNSVREIKQLILAEFRRDIQENAHSFIYVTKLNGRTCYKEHEILKSDFSMDVFRGQEIRVEYSYGYGNSSNTAWFSEHSSSEIEELFERYDKYKKLEMNSIEEAKKELQETDRKIQELRANTLQQLLLNKEFEEELPEEVKNNSLLMVLLRNGYINENYADYINYFREGAISRSELNFIRTVRNNQGECQFDYVIYHHANVIEKLFDYEFDQTELLNYTFEKIISKYRIQSFDYQCNEFEEDRLYLMIQKKYIPFSADILKELKEMSQQLWLNYIKNYKEKFLDDIAVSEIDLDDVKSLIRSDIFSGKEVKNILGEIDVTKIDVELSKMLLVFSEEVIFEKTYVEAVWEELPEENRYRWLYNQMDAYNLDELAEHFAQLEATYHQFAQRTQHKYKVHNNEFNMQLCEKLKRRGFLTSVNYKGKWIEGYVKKAV